MARAPPPAKERKPSSADAQVRTAGILGFSRRDLVIKSMKDMFLGEKRLVPVSSKWQFVVPPELAYGER
jgi:hypothetical protein